MNIHRTTCAAPNADLRELLEQIEKVMQVAWVVVYKDVQPLGSQVEGPSGPPIRRCAPTASLRFCRSVLLAKAQLGGTCEILARYRGDLGRRRKINDGFRTIRWGDR